MRHEYSGTNQPVGIYFGTSDTFRDIKISESATFAILATNGSTIKGLTIENSHWAGLLSGTRMFDVATLADSIINMSPGFVPAGRYATNELYRVRTLASACQFLNIPSAQISLASVDRQTTLMGANFQGFVGIGTGITNPVTPLDVRQNFASGTEIVAVGSDAYGNVVRILSQGASGATLGALASGIVSIGAGTGDQANSIYARGGAVLATSLGSVGIGTASPGAKLDVAGDGRFSTTLTATNGTVLQMKTSFSTNYVIGSATNQQVFMVNTTNGLVTLPDATKSAGIVFRILSTNGFGSYTVTNATGTQTMRDGVSLSEKIVGIKPADFISDGAAWYLVSKLRTVMPNAQFSTSTNIAFTSAATAYPISYDTTIRNNSQGIALTALTNGLNGRIYITNSGQYSIMFSAVQVSGHSTDKINIWLMQHGTNAPASATESVIGSANGQIPVTVEYIVDVGANPEYFELYGDASGTGCSLLANAASGYKPAMPSMIVTVKKISDPYP